MCVSVHLLIRKKNCSFCFTCTHLHFHFMLVFLTGQHGLRVNFGPEACAFRAELARNWAEKLSLSLWQDCYSLLTYILVYLRGGLSTGTA